MARKKPRRAQKKNAKNKSAYVPVEPWIKKRNGFLYIGLLSVALAVFTGWQLYPTEGLGRAILWGLGFAAAIWAIFGVSLAFNQWTRGRRQR
ncbi:MAG: hypothetical protein KC419_06300 [Anaerolineales bacterium]|nr:hypothetical protein [Anaerolineales bacterium]MCA9928066.1 hypothetical protein [Anaerolineales bacterium]